MYCAISMHALHMAIHIFDKVIEVNQLTKKVPLFTKYPEYVAIGCLYLSAKAIDIKYMYFETFYRVCKSTYIFEEKRLQSGFSLMEVEESICDMIDFSFNQPYALKFYQRYIKAAGFDD